MHVNEEFDALYGNLARAWDTHQALRRTGADFPVLIRSWFRLESARHAMWDWRSSHILEHH